VTGRNEREIGLLRAALAGLEDPTLAERLPRDGDADLELFIQVARRHRLTPLLSAVAGERLSAALAAACRRDRLLVMARNLMLARAAEECVRALAEKDVPVIVLKGIAYDCAFYSAAGTRPTADVDLLVPAGRRRAAFAVLDGLGFEPRAAAAGFDEADYHEVAWQRGDVAVDLHLALAPLVRCRIDYDEVWRSASPITIGDTQSRMLDAKRVAVFHALHMAIDHFDVPALYLLDLARQLPSQSDLDAAQIVARAWGCSRPFETSIALAEEFLPLWRVGHEPRSVRWFARRVTSRYGSLDPLPRPEQLARKLAHFDDPLTALRYTVVQGRRKVREVLLRRFHSRSARERLALDPE
jgi:hypothetical protein